MPSIYTILNTIALLGWSLIFFILLSNSFLSSLSNWTAVPSNFVSPITLANIPLIELLIFLEGLCFFEVGRIALGQLKGNFVLGLVLHIIRLSCISLILTKVPEEQDVINTMVLYSWALTEVGRYPMYLFPSSTKARSMRLVLPIITFPVGAIAEVFGAYRELKKLLGDPIWDHRDGLFWLKIALLSMVVLVNSILGPTLAYPALLKKGLPVLLGKGDKSKRDKFE